MTEGSFRKDLFYRLNVFPIQVPALRDRVDDIPLLVEYLVDRYAKKAGKRIRSISKDTVSLFRSYGWPGNIRELQNVIERAVVLCDGEVFCVDPSWLAPASPNPIAPTIPLVADLSQREKAIIENALREAREPDLGSHRRCLRSLAYPNRQLDFKMRKLESTGIVLEPRNLPSCFQALLRGVTPLRDSLPLNPPQRSLFLIRPSRLTILRQRRNRSAKLNFQQTPILLA